MLKRSLHASPDKSCQTATGLDLSEDVWYIAISGEVRDRDTSGPVLIGWPRSLRCALQRRRLRRLCTNGMDPAVLRLLCLDPCRSRQHEPGSMTKTLTPGGGMR